MSGLSQLPAEIRALRPVKTLEANFEKGRLAHAILLKGDDLALLESVALALAGSILKSKGKADAHADYFTLRPSKKSRRIIVGERGKDEPNTMRHLIRELNQTSNQGGYKVAVVYEADRLNPQAANAFLKTLEEPPPQTLILLLSTRPYDIIETIRSRSFQFKIPSKLNRERDEDWTQWISDYRSWIKWLHVDSASARTEPDRAILQAYGLLSRFVDKVEANSNASWKEQADSVPEHLSDEELDAMKVGLQKGIRDKLLIDIEEATRLAAIELSHEVPFPSGALTQAIAALESCMGLLALNMKDDAALEGFFLRSLKIWTV
jgi:DNA polymerase-3 subunit delta'